MFTWRLFFLWCGCYENHMHEDDIIELFRPLADRQLSYSLQNDAALLQQADAITTDTIIEHIHFLPGTEGKLVAQKALRVNLSDMAAMGATATYYTLNLALPQRINQAWLASFAEGLKEDQTAFNIALLGGDITQLPAGNDAIVISVTMTGAYEQHWQSFTHDSATLGDQLYYAGQLGGATAGLAALQQGGLTDTEKDPLWHYYHLPVPQQALVPTLQEAGVCCAIDTSDGLLKALQLITSRSDVGADIKAANLPIKTETKTAMQRYNLSLQQLLEHSDDYGLLFTSPHFFPETDSCHHIGEITESGLTLTHQNGEEAPLQGEGYEHRFVM